MNESRPKEISYAGMKKIIEKHYERLGQNATVKITSEVDTDRYNGMTTTSIEVVSRDTFLGVPSKDPIYLSMDELKDMLNEDLRAENSTQEIVSITPNAYTTENVEGYGMGEHTVRSVANKTFSVQVREKTKSK